MEVAVNQGDAAKKLSIFLKIPYMSESEVYEKWNYLKHKNMVLVGGAYANDLTASVNQNLSYQFKNLDQSTTWGFVNATVIKERDKATIELIESPFTYPTYQRRILIAAGLTRIGTQKAVDYLINENWKYTDRAKKEFGEKNQILL
ncbi:MAG: hypothetical protein QME59_07785 [Candidatus Hydrothermarchaeota archaeon]|nr:hypothetical protein [Candidatus Hydrothermarchaeota archaeon]